MDSGTSQNFVYEKILLRLRLVLAESSQQMKVVNFEARLVRDATDMAFVMENWQGKCNLTVVPLDDLM